MTLEPHYYLFFLKRSFWCARQRPRSGLCLWYSSKVGVGECRLQQNRKKTTKYSFTVKITNHRLINNSPHLRDWMLLLAGSVYIPGLSRGSTTVQRRGQKSVRLQWWHQRSPLHLWREAETSFKDLGLTTAVKAFYCRILKIQRANIYHAVTVPISKTTTFKL